MKQKDPKLITKWLDTHGDPNISLKIERRLLSEIPKKELDSVETFADKQLNPIDFTFTHHFLDRLTDPRNGKMISKAELISFFKRLSKHKKEFINFIKNYQEFVVKHKRYLLNIPFVRIGNELVAKTIMRKKNFKTSNPEFQFEQYYSYLNERNVKKGKWVEPIINDRSEELIDLVQTAYKKTKDGSYVNSKGDLLPSDWIAKDFDDDPKLDVSIFYRKPRSGETWKGNKIQGIGHDGSADAKKIVLKQLKNMLSKNGYWVEASDAMEHVLYKMGVTYIDDESVAKKIFPNSNLQMLDDKGKYIRYIGSKKIKETIFGNPIV